MTDLLSGPIHRQREMLILRIQDGIGDFVLFSGALRALKERYPEYALTLVATDRFADLACACPYIDEVVIWDLEQWLASPWYKMRFLRKLRQRGSEWTLSPRYMRCGAGDYMVLWSKAQKRIGFRSASEGRSSWLQKGLDGFYTELIDAHAATTELDRARQFVAALGGKIDETHPTELWSNTQDKAWAVDYMRRHGLEQGDWVIIAPGSSHVWTGRRWPKERYAQIVRKLWDTYQIRTVLSGSQDEAGLVDMIADKAGAPHSVRAAGTMNLRQFTAVLGHACMCIGNDSGPVHMAVAVDTPTVCILGGGHFERYVPYGDRHIHRAVYHAMDCFKCNWKCIYDEFRCILEVGVDEVWAEIQENFLKSLEIITIQKLVTRKLKERGVLDFQI